MSKTRLFGNDCFCTCGSLGDSGGPLLVRSQVSECLHTVIGVTSYGKACGYLGDAGMYTRVYHYVPWIESGDSGGPLLVRSQVSECLHSVIGVTSYGKACGYLGDAGMYTRVYHYVPWIESVVWPGPY
ncbi:hypothetical protein PYW08_012493 [Mythimna loreyi]|uniref:Uncharacterized protein n=1 Tax=Mythimna loreyi TaxID=667449 RepID=A0ACC2Q345_9NEOP|nr:hypothetical protein PYW08_012493 [Mythimna loreyi]